MNQTIELPVDELKDALPGLSKVVSKSSSLPVLRSVRVARSKTGHITVQATDLDSLVTYHGQEPQAGAACGLLVPFEPFRNIVKACPSQERLHLVLDEKDRVTLRYFIGRTPVEQIFEVPFIDDWPKLPSVTEPAACVNADFKQALREALDCVGNDPSRLVTQGAFIDATKRKANYLVGTDGRHLYAANSFTLDLRESVIVPCRKFLLWPVFAQDGDWTVAVGPGKPDGQWLQIASARWTLLTKAIEGPYPKWRNVLPAGQDGTHVVLNEAAVAQLLETAPRLPASDETNQPVELEVRDEKLWLKGRAKGQSEWTSFNVPGATVRGKPCCVRFNRLYLVKALRWGLHDIELHDATTPVVFSHAGRRLVVAVIGDQNPHPDPASPSGPAAPAQPEPTPVTSPSVPRSETPTEERNPMPATTQPTATRQQPANGETEARPSALRAALDHLETTKNSLRDLLGHVSETANLLKAAEKEKRATEQEIESVRRTLRSLQRVQL